MDVEQKSRFTVTPSSKAVAADARAVLLEDPGFGRLFTDHMVTIRYSESQAQELAPYLVTDPVTPLLQSYLDRIDPRRVAHDGVADNLAHAVSRSTIRPRRAASTPSASFR